MINKIVNSRIHKIIIWATKLYKQIVDKPVTVIFSMSVNQT